MIVSKKNLTIVLLTISLAGYPVNVMADNTQQSSSQISATSSSQVQSSNAASSKIQSDQNSESKNQSEISSSSDEPDLSSSNKSEKSGKTNQSDTPESDVVTKNGWVTDNNRTFYYENNHKVIGEKFIDGYWYLFDKYTDGAMVTGFQNLAGYGQNKTVYYNANGQMLYGEQKVGGNWYLFNNFNGARMTGFQNLVGYGQNKTVYYNANGQMLYGEQKITGNWYLFDKFSGARITGFRSLAAYGHNKTVYYNSNGQMLYGKLVIKNTVYTFNNQNGALYFEPYYYAQNNIAWGNVRFGNYTMAQTGCVMASLAMVITGYGNNVTPLQVATYGYNHGTFNHGEPGANQKTLVTVAMHYGLTTKGLTNQSQIQNTLENGHPVVIAVQRPFIPWYGVTHEIVVSKYSAGKVYVQDPLGTTTGWHTLSSLWNYRSTVSADSMYFSTPAVALSK